MKKELEEFGDRRKTLKDLDLFVLDNSLRETTVGQLRGHTLGNKRKIYDQPFGGRIFSYRFIFAQDLPARNYNNIL